MSYQFKFPKDKAEREETIGNIISQGKALRNPQSVRWWLANLYMQGLREFSAINYQAGTVSVAYLNEAGILKFRHEQIVSQYQAQLGRLLAIDLSPKVKRKGVSLDGLRKASVAQVVLDASLPQEKVDAFQLSFCPSLLLYGTMGVGLWVESDDSQGLEAIPPWELLPLPLDVHGPSGVRGLIRIRPVPVSWVENLAITPGSRSDVYKSADHMEIPTGHIPIDLDPTGGGLVSATSAGNGFFIRATTDGKSGKVHGGRKKSEKNVPITNLVEVWTETADGYLAEYRIFMGMTKFKEIYEADHSENRYPMPIRVVRDVTVGGFWGRSFVDQLLPLNNEIEYGLSSLFQSLSDFDLYGLQLWPATLGTPPLAERGQDGIKRLRYEPDYTCPEAKIENVMPAKLTAPQLNVITLASSLMDKMASQPTKMMEGEAPGRVDSSAGLGFLFEVSGIPLSATAKNIAGGVSGVYRALLRILKDRWTDQKVVEVSCLDDSLAGIVLDAKEGTMSLGQNAIPHPEEVTLTVASETPVSEEHLKAELKEALVQNRITLDEFNRKARILGLNLPVGDELGWQSYRRAKMENIVLFGDGQVPGKVIVSDRDVHRIHREVLQTFMAGPEFFASSAEVREAFVAHDEEHKTGLGQYPDQLPYPEEAAEGMLGPEGPPQMEGPP